MNRSRLTILLALLAVMALPACGKKSVDDDLAPSVGESPSESPTPPPPPFDPPPPPPDEDDPVGTGDAPLSFEIFEYGGSAVYETAEIPTDNILRVRFEVGPAGNQLFDSTDVRVEISVNGTTRIPHYTTDPACPQPAGCEYGRPSDGASDPMDFSASLQAGVDPVITVTRARYNWYCEIYVLPYPSCYRLVQDPQVINGNQFEGHYWSGRLIVQTNATNPDLFEGPNP